MFLNSRDELRDYLKYHDKEGDEFWFGEDQVFELFFVAGSDGPSNAQLDAYLDFQKNHLDYMDNIRAKVIDAWERERGQAPKRFYNEVPFVDIITVNTDNSETSIDIVLSFRTFKLLFYSRWTTYVAKFKGRELKVVKTARVYEREQRELDEAAVQI